MGLHKGHGRSASPERGSHESLSGEIGNGATRPELARRHANRKSTIKSGRTIGEAREHLETANERAAARKKDKRRQTMRVLVTVLIFIVLAIILVIIYFCFFAPKTEPVVVTEAPVSSYEPSIEIVDEEAASAGSGITARMREYIGRAEADFKDLGYTPVKAVVPVGAIREVDFYLDGRSGYIKMIIDRDTAISVEDADRMLRYLSGQGIADFEYIDVRVDGKAYWK